MNTTNAIEAARTKRLNRGLLALASWCRSRAMLPHKERTTATMLRRKVDELFASVDRAGWEAAKNPGADEPRELMVWEDCAELLDEASKEYHRLSGMPNGDSQPAERTTPHTHL